MEPEVINILNGNYNWQIADVYSFGKVILDAELLTNIKNYKKDIRNAL